MRILYSLFRVIHDWDCYRPMAYYWAVHFCNGFYSMNAGEMMGLEVLGQ